jgi:hypothetical protein
MADFLTDRDRSIYSIPVGGQWFWKQAPVLEAYGLSGGVTIAWDKPDGKKIYGLYSDKNEVMHSIMKNPSNKRWGYEIIPANTACLAYADIELISPTPDPQRVIITSIISVIRSHIKINFKRTGEFYVLDGSRLMDDGMYKVSYHLVIADIVFACNHDGNMKRLFTIADPGLYFTGTDGVSKYCIDLSVYTKNRLFRLPGCCKLNGAQVPLVRINSDPMDDEFTDQNFEIDYLIPLFVSKPLHDEDSTFISTSQAAGSLFLSNQSSTASVQVVQSAGGSDVPQRPAKRCRVENDSKPLPFPLVILRNLLVDAGDTASHPTKMVYKEEEKQWQIQCDQQKNQRKCLVNPQETHKSNNCIIFVQKCQAQFRCQVHCTASSCSSMQKHVLGYVAMGPDLEWQYGPFEEVYHDQQVLANDSLGTSLMCSNASHNNVPDSSDMKSACLEDEIPLNRCIPAEPPVTAPTPQDCAVVPSATKTTSHSKLPAENTYSDVKKTHEELCFKVLSPSGYAVLLPGRYEPDLMSSVQLRQRFANLYYFGLDRKMVWEKRLFIDAWIADEDIRQVTEIVVDPVCKRTDVYNMWRPFAVTLIPPVDDADIEQLVAPILKHISDVIVVGNVSHLNWMIDYLANMVQYPDRKSQVAISLYGVEGCGKGIIFEFFRRAVLGDFCSFQTSDPDNDLFGRFANGALHRVCIQVDEVKSLHENGCRLKDFITNSTINYERKGKDKITVRNISNLILTSNNENALSVSPEDRRFSLFRCSPVHKRNKAYFTGLACHLAKPVVARAFYQYLLLRDLRQYDCDFQASRPITEYYKETQLANIPPLMRFLSCLVNQGDGPTEIAARRLYETYQNFHAAGNYKFIMTEASFGREIKRIDGVVGKRITTGIMYQLDKELIKSFLKESNKYDPDA